MSRGRHRMGRRRRDLQRRIVEQQSYIDLCEDVIRRLSDERDRLLRNTPPDSEDPTVHMPRPVLLDETTEIPVITPDGASFMTTVRPRRPSWARSD